MTLLGHASMHACTGGLTGRKHNAAGGLQDERHRRENVNKISEV